VKLLSFVIPFVIHQWLDAQLSHVPLINYGQQERSAQELMYQRTVNFGQHFLRLSDLTDLTFSLYSFWKERWGGFEN
jgi:hypothetical protein